MPRFRDRRSRIRVHDEVQYGALGHVELAEGCVATSLWFASLCAAIARDESVDIVNEDDVVGMVRASIEGLFPKVCGRCGRRFDSLGHYLQTTTHLGNPVIYDAMAEEATTSPLGPISHASCPCGNTLLGSEGIPPAQMVELMGWARADVSRRSIGMRELLRQLRDRIDAEVLSDERSR